MSKSTLKSNYSNSINFKILILSAIIIISSFILLSGTNAHETKNEGTVSRKKNLIVIGKNEQVIINNPDNDKEVKVLAKIDTGADRTSIGTEIAESLDLESDRTVKVISSIGGEKRPIADVIIKLAGKNIKTAVSVADRSDLSRQMILGRDVLSGFLINVNQDQITSPDNKIDQTERNHN